MPAIKSLPPDMIPVGGAIDAPPPDMVPVDAAQQQGAIETSAAVPPSSPRSVTNFPLRGPGLSNFNPADVPAFKNIPRSAVKFGQDLIQPVLHPVDTAKNLYSLGKGIIQLAIPGEQADEKTARAVGQFYLNRYGSVDNIRKTIAEDPVGALADLSTVLTGGGAVVGRVPGMVGRAGRAAQSVGQITNPMRPITESIKAVGRGGANLVGAVGTHTGATSLREAYRAGTKGGTASQTFTGNMRGKIPPQVVVDDAKRALAMMRQKRSSQYRSGMTGVKADTTVLDFRPIRQAVDDVAEIGTYKGKTLNKSAADIWAKIRETVDDWEASSPSDFHTPEGLDALKRAIGDIRDSADFGTPSRRVAEEVYHTIKAQIVNQAPKYAKVMKKYEEASDLITDIEKTLSLNPKANIDTALRKLQSVMRNNVNTTYGRRVSLAQSLQKTGGNNIIEGVAGQSLNTLTPRGMGAVMAPMTMGAGITNPYLLGLLPLQSPRLMGEVSHGLGVASRYAPQSAVTAAGLGTYQSGRAFTEKEKRRRTTPRTK